MSYKSDAVAISDEEVIGVFSRLEFCDCKDLAERIVSGASRVQQQPIPVKNGFLQYVRRFRFPSCYQLSGALVVVLAFVFITLAVENETVGKRIYITDAAHMPYDYEKQWQEFFVMDEEMVFSKL